MNVSTSTMRDPARTWVVTLRTNNVSYPNWDGDSARQVLLEASDYLKQPITNLSTQLQKDWS